MVGDKTEPDKYAMSRSAQTLQPTEPLNLTEKGNPSLYQCGQHCSLSRDMNLPVRSEWLETASNLLHETPLSFTGTQWFPALSDAKRASTLQDIQIIIPVTLQPDLHVETNAPSTFSPSCCYLSNVIHPHKYIIYTYANSKGFCQ